MNLLPLSEFQYSVWKGQKMHPHSPLYNMIFTFDLSGQIDTEIFVKAYAELVDRTTSLNLVVDETDLDFPKQKRVEIAPQLEVIDLTRESNFNYKEWLEDTNQQIFDLSVTSYSSALIKVSDNHFVWYFNQHHIFTDAYCFQLLFNRMSSIYASLLNSEPITVESDWIQYEESCKGIDITKNHSVKGKGVVKRDLMSLYGKVITHHGTTQSQRFEFDVDEELIASIQVQLAKLGLRTLAANLDLLAFLMSSLLITLSKVGENVESHLMSNIFSQRFNKKGKTLYQPMLKLLNGTLDWTHAEGYEALHRKVYGFLIQRESAVAESDSLLPSTIVNFFNLEFGQFNGIDSKYLWRHCGHMDSHHSLRLHVFKYTQSDQFTFAFDLKGSDEVNEIGQRLIQDFKTVMSRLIQDEFTLDQLCLLSESQLNTLQSNVATVNSLDINEKEYFINELKANALKTPNAIALYGKNEVSYQELMQNSSALANRINSLVSKENFTIAIYLPRSEEFVFSVIGCLLQGASFVPIPTNSPKERVKYLLENSQASLLIHNGNSLDVNLPLIDVNTINYSDHQLIESTPQVGAQCYTLYTSGSTGRPKGVPISQAALTSYLKSSKDYYLTEESYHMPLFTSVGFDLTMTSLFLPLYTGGSLSIYEEQEGIDLSIREVISNTQLNCFKCTPSHLNLISGLTISSGIKAVLVGGENFTQSKASDLYQQSGGNIRIFNEYGPTECTIGCIVHQFDPNTYQHLADVPIGLPMNDCAAFIIDHYGVPLPDGVLGELCLSGPGLSEGYQGDSDLTQSKYVTQSDFVNQRYYKTGDYARVNEDGLFEYYGRKDTQIKVNGIRIEKGEIEKVMEGSETISNCVVVQSDQTNETSDYIHCAQCGLPSNYPTADFDEYNVCGYCRNYDTYEKKVEKYFESEQRFAELFAETQPHDGEYDCIMLFSGGKDSSYALGKLVAMGLKVLTFTLDNGYISDNAKENISKIVKVLGVDHIFGSTPHMNEIFVDSLKTHCNVCNGCFKTIYNLSLKIAYEKRIPIIVTGLSRGQFFETKLSEEIFWKPMDDVAEIDKTLFEAREAYHGVRDIAYDKTDGAFIEENQVLQSVRIVDFYRYHDVTLEKLYEYINTDLPWVRPEDTGRSTNCLINKVGIYVHRQERGYSNYAFPYSWDVRTGHKTKEETIDEVEEVITEEDVMQIIEEIGYESEASEGRLIAYYTGNKEDVSQLRSYAGAYLPDYMIPSQFIHVDEIPMTQNGKVDYKQLSEIEYTRNQPIIEPTNELEELLLEVWKEVMLLDEISTDDNFFEIGGTSLHAIRIVARIEKQLDYTLGVQNVFKYPSIQGVSTYILEDMQSILESDTD